MEWFAFFCLYTIHLFHVGMLAELTKKAELHQYVTWFVAVGGKLAAGRGRSTLVSTYSIIVLVYNKRV